MSCSLGDFKGTQAKEMLSCPWPPQNLKLHHIPDVNVLGDPREV